MACSSSSEVDLTVVIGHAHVPNKDWAAIGDKSDAYAKVMVDQMHKKSDVIYNNNHPTFNVRLHLGCVSKFSTMLVELRDLDSLSTDDLLVQAHWEDWADYDLDQTKRLHNNDDLNDAYYVDVKTTSPTTSPPTPQPNAVSPVPTTPPHPPPTPYPHASPTPHPHALPTLHPHASPTHHPHPSPTHRPVPAPTRHPHPAPTRHHLPSPTPTRRPALQEEASKGASAGAITGIVLALVVVLGGGVFGYWRYQKYNNQWNRYRWQRAPTENEFSTPAGTYTAPLENPIQELAAGGISASVGSEFGEGGEKRDDSGSGHDEGREQATGGSAAAAAAAKKLNAVGGADGAAYVALDDPPEEGDDAAAV